MASFERKTGAQRDLAELCYVSALHQTASDVRKDGSIRDEDIALYLRSRHSVVVSEEEVRNYVLPGLAGIATPCGSNTSSGGDAGTSASASTAASTSGSKNKSGANANANANEMVGSNDDGAMDLAELTALLLIPSLVNLAEEHYRATAASSDGSSDDDMFRDGANTNAKSKWTSTSNSPDIIAAALEVILNDIGSLQGYSADCDPANGVYPELTPELLRTILTTYGEEELAADERVIEEMMTVALLASSESPVDVDITTTFREGDVECSPKLSSNNKSNKSSSEIRLDPATFARVLTADLGLLRSVDHNRISTNYQDVLDTAIAGGEDDDGVAVATKGEEDVEAGSSSSSAGPSYFDLHRFRFATSSIDFAGGRYASKAMVALLWASFIMFVFAELVVGGDLSSQVVTYILFIENNPCRYVAFADSIGNPPITYNHTFRDGTTYDDWVEPCEDYTESFWLKIGKSTTVWLYRFVVFMCYGVAFIGLGSLGNSTDPGRCCNRRVAAAIGILSLVAVVFVPFVTRVRGEGLCPTCYADDASFRFTAYAYFIFTALVICIQLSIVLGLNKLPKLKKIIDSEVYGEAGMKQAAHYKTIEMMKNAVSLHSGTISTNTRKSNGRNGSKRASPGSSLGTALLNFFTVEQTESVGGFLWCWKKFLRGDLFYKEGISLSGRVIAINLIQGCLVIYVLIGGILLSRHYLYLWRLGKSQIDGMVDFIIEYFNLQDVILDISQKIDTSGICSDLPDPALCDTIKDYVSGDTIQAFVSSIAYSAYPTDAYMISVPFGVLTVVAFGAALVLFSLYIPSVCRTILRFRCGDEPLFNDSKCFKMYRTRVDMTTQLLGTIFWTGLIGPIILGILAMLPTFFLLWQTTRPLLFSIVAAIIGVFFAVVVKEIVATVIMKTSYKGFYRKRVTRNNIGGLALETVTIGLGVFYAIARVAKILIVTLLYISRIDTNLLSLDLNVGPLNDAYPRFFRQALLLQESHKHPWLEVLGKMYLMKIRYREKFVSSAGYSYRLVFALSLLPYLRKYRLTNRGVGQGDDEGKTKMFNFPFPKKLSKRATEVTSIERVDSEPLIGESPHSDYASF